MKTDQSKYELMVIINSEIGQDAVKKKLSSIKKELEENGEVFFEDLWGERDLGYPMKKKTRGYYAVFNFYQDGSKINELNNSLRLDNEVIRHMVITLPLKYEPKTLAELSEKKEESTEEDKSRKPRSKKRSA